MLNDKKDILALTGDGIVFFRMRSARFINSTIGFQLYRPPGYWVFSCCCYADGQTVKFFFKHSSHENIHKSKLMNGRYDDVECLPCYILRCPAFAIHNFGRT